MKTKKIIGASLTLAALLGMSFSSYAGQANGHDKEKEHGRGSGAVIYVASQDKFYDTILLGDLPYNDTNNFQQLFPGEGPAGAAATTAFGPGDVGYYGGRWWVDANGNDMMDEEDVYFLCPLLGPGSSEI